MSTAEFSSTSTSWNSMSFREDLVERYKQNGRQLLEELDKFTSLARQILIARRKEQEKKEAAELTMNNARMEEDGGEDEEEDEQEQQQDASQQRRQAAVSTAAGAIKNLPVTVKDEERAKEREERRMEKAKKRVRSSRLVTELQEEMEEDRPEVVRERPLFATFAESKREEARRRYEEDNFMRLSKTEKRRASRPGMNQLESELLTFGQYRLPEGGDAAEQGKSRKRKIGPSKKGARRGGEEGGEKKHSFGKKKGAARKKPTKKGRGKGKRR